MGQARLDRGLEQPEISGWASRQYGQKTPAFRARWAVAGNLPLVVTSLLLLHPIESGAPPLQGETRLLPVAGEAAPAIFTRAALGGVNLVFVHTPQPGKFALGDMALDGRMAFFAEDSRSGATAACFKDTRSFQIGGRAVAVGDNAQGLFERWDPGFRLV
jgi:hypothetical protein